MAKRTASAVNGGRIGTLKSAPKHHRLLAIIATCFSFAFGLAMPINPAAAGTLDAVVARCKPKGFRDPLPDLVHSAATLRKGGQLRILTIGSSSTQGIGATADKFTYPAQLMTDLNTMNGLTNVDVRNAGIGGETIDQTLLRLRTELDTYKPDLVIWQLGTNDAVTSGTDPKDFRARVDVGIKSIADHEADMILLDQQFYLKIRDTNLYERFVQLVDDAAESHGIGLFPRYKLMQTWNATLPEGITPMLGPDGFHMGDKGYICLGALIADQIATSIAHANSGTAKISAVPKSTTLMTK
jgi:lysophospholipase L1-like esterase